MKPASFTVIAAERLNAALDTLREIMYNENVLVDVSLFFTMDQHCTRIESLVDAARMIVPGRSERALEKVDGVFRGVPFEYPEFERAIEAVAGLRKVTREFSDMKLTALGIHRGQVPAPFIAGSK